jgi:hypothetical protein
LAKKDKKNTAGQMRPQRRIFNPWPNGGAGFARWRFF